MIRPPRLHPGDVVRVIAPSGPVPREGFAAGAAVLGGRYQLRYDDGQERERDQGQAHGDKGGQAESDFFHSAHAGLRAPNTGLFARDGFLAGSDERRIAELRAAFADPEARAVVMARGGYGLTRLLPFIEPGLFMARPVPVVGFSDGTALLGQVNRAGVLAIHGPVVTQLPALPAEDHAGLFRLLEEPSPGVVLHELSGLVPGRVQGPLLGGNLEVFSRLLGTPFMPDPTGAILFIEDLGERPYRIDRLITHLDSAGIFSAVAGVVVGDFSACLEPEPTRANTPTAAEVLDERLGRLAIPVATGAPIGHGARNMAVPYGAMVELDTRFGTLTALQGVVS